MSLCGGVSAVNLNAGLLRSLGNAEQWRRGLADGNSEEGVEQDLSSMSKQAHK